MLNNVRLPLASNAKIFSVRSALLASAFVLAILLAAPGFASAGHTGFGFNGDITVATNAASLSGGGSFDPDAGFLKAGGGFRCNATIAAGPLAGCQAGEGVRWHADELLASSGFKCIGSESLKTAFTGVGVVVMKADFYRAGDGNNASFSANMFVSDHDLDPDVDGIQNLWIQVVGCGDANVNISSH
jgi:hypothetical protein